MKRVLIVALLVAAIFISVWVSVFSRTLPKPSVSPPPVSPAPAPDPGPDPLKVEFGDAGLNEQLLRVNAGVTGAGNVKIAVRNAGQARWVLVLAAGMEKHASLDGVWTIGDFPELRAAGFQDPPPPILQSMSILRSVTRREMNFSAASGDRIVVLFCPKAEWDGLKLRWPDK